MSSSSFDLSKILAQLLGASPFLLVAVAGLVLCMIRAGRPARVRIAVGCAVALQIGSYLALPLVYSHVFQLVQPMGADLNLTLLIVRLFGSLVSGTALALLLYAAFARDDPPPAENFAATPPPR
jgi:uncharacterized protein YhhL (DUF1145 family)